MAAKYKHNSDQKDFIRNKWVEFVKAIKPKNPDQDGYAIITFPSDEMTDLELFAEKGIISWEKTETGSMRITRGSVFCFEKDQKKFNILNDKLSDANVYREFGTFLTNQYRGLKNESIKLFPVDAINLDYEKLISKNEVPIEVIIKYIFEFQSKYQKDFSLFLTWPKPHNITDEDPQFLDSLKQTINNNLSDPRAEEFKNVFTSSHKSIDDLTYEPLSIIGLTKQILAISSSKNFQISKHEFYSYAGVGKQPMVSVLYLFEYIGSKKSQTLIYTEDVIKALSNVVTL